ncbi:GAF domain-containing protein [Arthrobacter sp. I2-34]|uniref:GAF domain-containing protein n=1 Tax=Arthrobacter hankyongi TaxID=2904801 RepID=A0ABS9L1E4_9MICC|nr:GAF domain-containing protein [Arthrobacter hankyongi]MCG2620453.1 GAF domain-containing protein [Arthrobacter hankyongi]
MHPRIEPSELQSHRAQAAHDQLDRCSLSGPAVPGGLRTVVRESWRRSLRALGSPGPAAAPLALDGGELEEYRRHHQLAAVMPVIGRLLVQPAQDTGLLVAVGDEHGRLLWVDGDRAQRRRAESMAFLPGADWSEAAVGTSAPGTALALGRGIQISGAEHFNPAVHPWSCTAVPVHDPDTGALVGVVDITGREAAVAPHTLPLVQAAVAAAEAQLRINRLERALPRGTHRSEPARPAGVLLEITGRDQGRLTVAGRRLELSLRHTEILTLLALHPRGLRAEELAELLYPEDGRPQEVGGRTITLRAEMVRLRRFLAAACPELVPQSRPYRLPQELSTDASRVLAQLRRGAHRQALETYRGELLPRSTAPGIAGFRSEVGLTLREAVLADGAPETLLCYLQLPQARDDAEAWRCALRLLPARSPRRAAVVARLQELEADI